MARKKVAAICGPFQFCNKTVQWSFKFGQSIGFLWTINKFQDVTNCKSKGVNFHYFTRWTSLDYNPDHDHQISFRVEDSGRPKVWVSFRVNSVLTLNTSKLQTLPYHHHHYHYFTETNMCQMRGGWGNNEDKYLVGDMRQYEQMMRMYVSSLELSPIYDSIWKIHGDFGIVHEQTMRLNHLYLDVVRMFKIQEKASSYRWS